MARANTPEANEILDLYFPVLDHGFIALVDYMGDDQAIVDAATTSYGLGTKRVTEDRGLERYLYRHRHTTPMEMVELKFHCKMPVFVARQWIRHRTANVNEYSGRYSLMPMQFYSPKREQVATQSKANKQGRSDNLLQIDEYGAFMGDLEEMRALAEQNYTKFIKEYDVAREVARLDLPLSLYTEWYWKIDAHNLTHFLGQRCHHHAQWEVRQYANLMAGMLKRCCPNLFEAWVDYHPNIGAVTFSRQEVALLREMIHTMELEVQSDGVREAALWTAPERVSQGQMQVHGLSKREAQAFLDIFDPAKPPPGFGIEAATELDLSTAKPAEYFAEETKKYCPKVDVQ